jgi:carbon-monoxide dehydrogenase small subunit
MKRIIKLKVNGTDEEVLIEPWWTLSRVLRDELNLNGAKIGCETGDCGSCTILVDGKTVKSCIYPAMKAIGKEILTIEGLEGKDGCLHPLQEAFIAHFAVQCGFCTPGMILTAKALLDENPNPSETEIREALIGNLCRCTGYVKVVEAILAAGEKMKQSRAKTQG